jgi:hypothetical protein
VSAPEQPGGDGIDVAEVLAELDDAGRTKWDLAVARVQNRHLLRRIADLENAQAPTSRSAVPDPTQGGDGA